MANERKMTLRPAADTIDIDDLIASAGGGTPEDVAEPRPRQERKARPVRQPVREEPRRASKRVGRPPKVKAEKRNQKVAISLTEAERQKLKEKSGMIPEASYLLSVLREAGVFD